MDNTLRVIDGLLKRDLLGRTRSELEEFRVLAASGGLHADDQEYVHKLFARLSGSTPPPEINTRPPIVFSYPAEGESSWLEGFIQRIGTVGFWIAFAIFVLVVIGSGIAGFAKEEGSLPVRLMMGVLYAGLGALGVGFFLWLAAIVLTICSSIIGGALKAVLWLLFGKRD